MGFLHYGGRNFPMEDRLLAHVQIIIGMKLRRGERFFLTWVNDPASGSGRNSIWIDNGIPLFCEFAGNRMPSINREWVETLAASASMSFGLQITPEDVIEPIQLDGPEDS